MKECFPFRVQSLRKSRTGTTRLAISDWSRRLWERVKFVDVRKRSPVQIAIRWFLKDIQRASASKLLKQQYKPLLVIDVEPAVFLKTFEITGAETLLDI
ncbi:hypothetical protein GN956_G25042 [Arapaima gigas]